MVARKSKHSEKVDYEIVKGNTSKDGLKEFWTSVSILTSPSVNITLAEKEGFEPPVPLPAQLISSQPHSASLALLLQRPK